MIQTFRRSFVPAAWLGWQIESNWTEPLLFLAFSVLRPLASVMILVFMFRSVARVGTDSPLYGYIFLGNAFYVYVVAIMAGASFSILDDRERYRSLKYIYIAPVHIPSYLFGRAMARFLTGTIAVVITVIVGVLVLNVPIHPFQVNWPMFIAAMLLGVISLGSMGIILGSLTLTIRSEAWFLGEATAGALALFSGAVFPVTLLPRYLQPIGFVLPMTYWLELVRRALLGPAAVGFPTLAAFGNTELFAILSSLTAAFSVAALLAFRYFDRVAREKGLIDVQSNF
jgi:ABC-2 type transport system permease protein